MSFIAFKIIIYKFKVGKTTSVSIVVSSSYANIAQFYVDLRCGNLIVVEFL